MTTNRKPLYVFLLALSIPALLGAGEPRGLTYTVTDTRPGGNPPTTLYVSQVGQRAIARPEAAASSEVAVFSDPAQGIRAAAPNPFGLPVMRSLVGGRLASLEVGDRIKVFGVGEEEKVEAVHYELRRGDRDRMLLGRKAVHSVLTVELELSQADGEGEVWGDDSFHAVGKAHLWTLPELPFSWIPYTASRHLQSKAAIPFSLRNQEIAAFLLDHFAPQLEELGLLVRAEVESTITTDFGERGGNKTHVQTEGAEVVVSGLETDLENLELEPPAMAVLTGDQLEVLNGGGYVLSRAGCEDASSGGRLSLEISSDGSGPIVGEGDARPVSVEGQNRTLLALQSVETAEDGGSTVTCAVIVLPGEELVAGEYPLTARKPEDGAETSELALALFAVIEGQRWVSMSAVSSGRLVISERDGELRGELTGKAFTLSFPDEGSSALHEDLDASLVFDVIPPGESPGT